MFLVHFSLGISCWFYLSIYFLPHSNHSRRLCSFWLRDEELSSFEYFHKNVMVWWFDKSHAPSSIISVYNQSIIHCADVCRYSEREQHVFKSQQKKQKKRTPKCDHLQHKLTIYCCAAWNSFVMSHKPNLISTQKRRMVMFRKLLDCQLFLCRPWRPVTMPDVIHHLEKWFSSWKRITWDP